jgi:hypothetical protein
MATQEQDFNKETNRQFTRLFIKDSQGITIDLTEVQCAQVLQSLLMLSDLQRRLKPSAGRGETVSKHFEHLLSPADGEMQDSELNSLLQGQSIYIENCTDVRISVRQLEVEKVVELGLVALGSANPSSPLRPRPSMLLARRLSRPNHDAPRAGHIDAALRPGSEGAVATA